VIIEKDYPKTILNHLSLSNNKNNNNIKNSSLIKNPKSKIEFIKNIDKKS